MATDNLDSLLAMREGFIGSNKRKLAEQYDGIIREGWPDLKLAPLPWKAAEKKTITARAKEIVKPSISESAKESNTPSPAPAIPKDGNKKDTKSPEPKKEKTSKKGDN